MTDVLGIRAVELQNSWGWSAKFLAPKLIIPL